MLVLTFLEFRNRVHAITYVKIDAVRRVSVGRYFSGKHYTPFIHRTQHVAQTSSLNSR
jgi:hypothetical protein